MFVPGVADFEADCGRNALKFRKTCALPNTLQKKFAPPAFSLSPPSISPSSSPIPPPPFENSGEYLDEYWTPYQS